MDECVAESRKHSPTDILQTETVAKQLKPRSGELPNRAVSVFYQNMCDRQLSRAADEAAHEFMSSTHVTVVVVMMAYMPFLEYQLLWALYMSSNLILRITERQVLPYLFSTLGILERGGVALSGPYSSRNWLEPRSALLSELTFSPYCIISVPCSRVFSTWSRIRKEPLEFDDPILGSVVDG